MTDFSVSQALGAGFRIIRRKPLAAVVWGLAYFVIAFVPILLVMSIAAPAMFDIFRSAAAGGEPDMDSSAFGALFASMSLLQPVMMLSVIAAQAVVMNAVFRATLEPEEGRHFYLRFGVAELWQGLVQFCLQFVVSFAMMGAFAVVAVLALIVGLTVMSSGVREFQPWMAVAAVFAVLLVVAACVWVMLRLSMAGPMTFAHRNFRLFESWRLTRGRTGSLLLLAVLIALVVMALYVVLITVFAVTGVLSVGGLAGFGDPDRIEDLFVAGPAGWIAALGALMLLMTAVFVVIGGFLFAITLAPWADAYRQLAAPGEGESQTA